MVLGLELRDLDIGHTRVIKFTAEPSKTHMHMHAYARAHTHTHTYTHIPHTCAHTSHLFCLRLLANVFDLLHSDTLQGLELQDLGVGQAWGIRAHATQHQQ